jgi:tetratricopeptide (TPR) repeat protein
LRLGELLIDAGRLDDADTRLREAVAKTSAPEWQGLRAHAYAGLGRCAEARDQKELALRYYLSVALLYDDPVLVPAALEKVARLHAALGHPAESEAAGSELIDRYPESAPAKAWKTRLPANPAEGKGQP